MVKVALLGVGFMGTMHSQCYANIPNAKVVAVADIRKERAEAEAAKHGARAYTNANTAIRREDVDLVDICLPTYLHCKYTISAAKAGRNVISEKPMSHKLREADRMVAAVRAAGVKFMCAHVIRFWPEYQLLKRYVDDGRLGKLLVLSLVRISPKPTWTWDNWIVKGELSGGVVADLHVHDADFVRYLCGEPLGLDSIIAADPVSKYDYIFTNFQYPGNLAVSAEGGWNLPSGYSFFMSYRAVFERGSLEFDTRLKPSLTECTADGKVNHPDVPQVGGTAAAGGNISSLGGYYNELKYFVDCVEKGQSPTIATAEDSRATVALLAQEIKSGEKKLKKMQ